MADRFQIVRVWVEDIRGVVAGMVLGAFAGTAVVVAAGLERGLMEAVDNLVVENPDR